MVKKVNHVIIGSGKCETTWLFEGLKKHPEVTIPIMKETDFFSIHYIKGISWYHSRFVSEKGKVKIDISPSYLSMNCSQRIAEYNKEMKIIMIIREPLERAFSHYCMVLRAGKATNNVDKEIVEGTRFVEDSLYYKYINRYRDYFPRENIKILKFENMISNPKVLFKELLEYLDVDSSFYPPVLNNKIHGRKGIPKYMELYNGIVNIYSKIYRNRYLNVFTTTIDKLRNSTKFMSYFHSILKESHSFPVLSETRKAELVEIFKSDMNKLEKDFDITNDYY